MDILKQLQRANKERCPEFGAGTIEEWPIEKWMLAITGEVGEMANLIKKKIRGDKVDHRDGKEITPELIGEEAADILIYLDMACQHLGIDLATVLVNKFNKGSDRIGSKVKMYY